MILAYAYETAENFISYSLLVKTIKIITITSVALHLKPVYSGAESATK